MTHAQLPFRLASLLVVAATLGNAELVYVGSAGCDGDDATCVEGDKSKERIIQAIDVAADGAFKLLPQSIDTGGMPIWLVPLMRSGSDSDHCLFVTRGDLNDIAVFTVSQGLDSIKFKSSFKSGGEAPVYASILRPLGDGEGTTALLVANYHGPDNATTSEGASAASFLIESDCSLTLADVKPHKGSSVNPQRQGGAHVHSFVASHDGTRGYACDLGMDQISVYDVSSTGRLSLLSVASVKPGMGPRHSVEFQDFLYVVNEMGEAVTAYKKEPCVEGAMLEGGKTCLRETQSLPLYGGKASGSKAAEIVMRPRPEGATLYATNRGLLNTVTVFSVAKDGSGRLTQVQQVEVPAYPRGMALAQSGRILLVAGQSRSELVSFHVDDATGLLTPTGHRLSEQEGLPPHPAAFGVFGDSDLPRQAQASSPLIFLE